MVLDFPNSVQIAGIELPVSKTATGESNSVDKLGFNEFSIALIYDPTTVTGDFTVTLTVEDSDDDATWSVVNPRFYHTNLNSSLVVDNSTAGIGYRIVTYYGEKRYFRLVYTLGGTSPDVTLGFINFRYTAKEEPVEAL